MLTETPSSTAFFSPCAHAGGLRCVRGHAMALSFTMAHGAYTHADYGWGYLDDDDESFKSFAPAHCAGAAGRRRLGRVSGGCLSRAARTWFGTRLGGGYLDWRHQCRYPGRQQGRRPAGAPEAVLGAYFTPRQHRHDPGHRPAAPLEYLVSYPGHRHAWRARLFQATQFQPVSGRDQRRTRASQLLRYQRTGQHLE